MESGWRDLQLINITDDGGLACRRQTNVR